MLRRLRSPARTAAFPDSCSLGLDQMHDDEHKHAQPDPKDLDIHVNVGRVRGLNRLYFLYQAWDNYWSPTLLLERLSI